MGFWNHEQTKKLFQNILIPKIKKKLDLPRELCFYDKLGMSAILKASMCDMEEVIKFKFLALKVL